MVIRRKEVTSLQNLNRSPYRALFGSEPKMILKGCDIPQSVIQSMQTAEDSDNTTKIQMPHGNETLNNPTNIEVPVNSDDSSGIEELKRNIKVMQIENIESFSSDCPVCSICGKKTSQAHFCSSFLKPVHSICGISYGGEGYGSEVLCFLCKNEQAIVNERQQAHKRNKRAAEKMIDNTAEKFVLLEIGK
ncbi:hypothetical protein HHI36_004574 [Cryptolaemus montrouzieri]|uniref:SCAN domain-containing protein n=1 Tax=Cryptolaemus montrouzieri TaxID=559131 RepID=A0ABD2NRJ8_9CUCU